MSRQFGSPFPDKNLRLILQGYSRTLQEDEQTLRTLNLRSFSQREQAYNDLKAVSEHLQEFFEWLENPTNLPIAIVPVRSQLLRNARQAYKQAQRLMLRIEDNSLNQASIQSESLEGLKLLRDTQMEILRLLKS